MITNPNPITTEPVPTKVYDQLYVASLTATQSKQYGGHIICELLPMTASGEIAPREMVQRISCHLEPAMNAVPELASAFAAVVAAIPATRAWLNAQGNRQQ
jgi:hypothetical protein